MAVTIPSPPTVPDVLRFGSGLPVLSDGAEDGDGWQELAQAINWLGVHMGTLAPAFQQGWPGIGPSNGVSAVGRMPEFRVTPGDGIGQAFVAVTDRPNDSVKVTYRIPWLSPIHTELEVGAYLIAAHMTTGAAVAANLAQFVVECRDSGGITDSVTVQWGGVEGWHFTTGAGNLTLTEWTSGAGYAQVEVTLEYPGSGGNLPAGTACGIERLYGRWVAPSSLAAYTAGGYRYAGIDDDETAADAALASDLAFHIRDNLEALDLRERVYMTWSALAGHINSRGSTSADRAEQQQAGRQMRRVHVPVSRGGHGSDRFELEVRAQCDGDASDDAALVVQHGGVPLGVALGGRHGRRRRARNVTTGRQQTAIEVAAPASAGAWYTATLTQPDPRPGEPDPSTARGPYEGYALSVWPQTEQATWLGGDATDPVDPVLRSLAIWGR